MLALCAFVFFLFFIGGGASGRQVDAIKGLVFGGIGLIACAYCAYRIYLGPGLTRWEWIALPVALFPIAMIVVTGVRSNQARARAEAAKNQ
jgi:hypothetical protein